MAFKIQTNFYPNPPKQIETKPKPKPPKEDSKNPPKIQAPTKPLGKLDNFQANTSNSAFSSLYLPKEEWLKKEFGIDIQNDEALKEKMEKLLQEKDNPSKDFLEQLLTELKIHNP